jgi:outer membrane protein TolC
MTGFLTEMPIQDHFLTTGLQILRHLSWKLINEGMVYNADIIIAKEKLNQIELAMEIAGTNLYPSVSAVANTSNNLVSESQISRLALKASWEIDLWGKNKSAQMASTSDYFSAKHQNILLHQSIAGMIAKAYFLILPEIFRKI